MHAGTLQPLPTQGLGAPPLVLGGRLTQHNDAITQLDTATFTEAAGGGAVCDLSAWPEFHNGVAAGEHFVFLVPCPGFTWRAILGFLLQVQSFAYSPGQTSRCVVRLSMAYAGLRLAAGGNQLSRTWIVYNKPEEPTYQHAGVLMALGLTGSHPSLNYHCQTLCSLCDWKLPI